MVRYAVATLVAFGLVVDVFVWVMAIGGLVQGAIVDRPWLQVRGLVLLVFIVALHGYLELFPMPWVLHHWQRIRATVFPEPPEK